MALRHDSDPNLPNIAVAGIAAIEDIDERTKQDTEALLSAMLSTAWPSVTAQNQ
jgi:hypothetical protein